MRFSGLGISTSRNISIDFCSSFGSIELRVVFQRFVDLPADGENRVERSHGLLEDHADFVATNVSHLRFAQGQEILILE